MTDSFELRIGKAGEHLVCADLIIKGHNAILSNQGTPYDVIVISDEGKLCRIQVKSTLQKISTKRNPLPHYRFGMKYRNTRQGRSRVIPSNLVDMFAFVAIDTKKIAYLPVNKLMSRKENELVGLIEFWEGDLPIGRIYSTGKIRYCLGKRIEDYSEFNF